MITPLNIRVRLNGDLLTYLTEVQIKGCSDSLCLLVEVKNNKDETHVFLLEDINKEKGVVYLDVKAIENPSPKLFDTKNIISIDDFRKPK